jgi:DNA-binding NarL/FixJ family response regulator
MSNPDRELALTEREWDILEYLVDGYRARAIADEMGWRSSSLSRYLLRMQNKLGARSSAHITVRATELGLLAVIDGQLQRNPETDKI